uniref:Small ribosomal subunit protein mS39 n=1 Tax=Cynoglossus semilaevis TaxID=244447 RepID=A0A3P8WXT6_CYNSE
MVPSSQKATRCCIKMAASGRHVGQYFKRNGRLLTFNLEPSLSRRSFGWTSSRGQVAADANKESDENIILPRKKTWSQVAVLEALSSTVGRDPTMYNYRFQDDPFLSPRSFPESKLFSKAQESGKAAAKYFIDSHPKFFTKDFAEPHIPCLMPQTVSVRLEEVSEEALKERISLRKVSAATDMYDQLLQSGTNVSMETTHDLLDLICLYCDQEPGQEVEPQTEDVEPAEERPRVRGRQNRERPEFTWRENNNAERIFNLLPHRDTRCYSALIRGTVKHKAYTKAFSLYTDLLNERLTADVHIFNALILAAPFVREKYAERWELMEELLTQMNQQSVQPSLLTFNNILKSLRRCDSLARSKSLQILSEMKAVGLVPSLATYNHVLGIFYKTSFTAKKTNILQEILSELRGKQFTCQDPDDVHFFRTAMKICLDIKDLELGYEVQRLVEVGENWRLLGNDSQSTGYYGVFFNLLCMMENVDGVLKWYKHLVPSLFYLNSQATRSLFQALDTDSRLDLLPLIWKDMKSSGLDKFSDLVEDLLTLMAREEHSPEVSGRS